MMLRRDIIGIAGIAHFEYHQNYELSDNTSGHNHKPG